MKNVEIKVKLWDVKIIHNLNFHVDSFLHFFFGPFIGSIKGFFGGDGGKACKTFFL